MKVIPSSIVVTLLLGLLSVNEVHAMSLKEYEKFQLEKDLV
jgi:hypothetical protein